MPSVHFVERLNNVRPLPDSPGEWESGYWVIAEDTAQRLVGGDLYLHSAQAEESHFGGTILSYRLHDDPAHPEIHGRVVFRIQPTPQHKGVQAGRAGWGNEKKIVW
ncbi:MAG: hypothetical protein ACRDFW_13565 [bacterium]